MFLLDDLLLLPVKGVIWLGEKFQEAAQAQMHDVGGLRKALDDLERRRGSGEISEEEFNSRAAAIFVALDEARKAQP